MLEHLMPAALVAIFRHHINLLKNGALSCKETHQILLMEIYMFSSATCAIRLKLSESHDVSSKLKCCFVFKVYVKDRTVDQRGVECESLKILQENKAYVSNSTRCTSLLTAEVTHANT